MVWTRGVLCRWHGGIHSIFRPELGWVPSVLHYYYPFGSVLKCKFYGAAKITDTIGTLSTWSGGVALLQLLAPPMSYRRCTLNIQLGRSMNIWVLSSMDTNRVKWDNVADVVMLNYDAMFKEIQFT